MPESLYGVNVVKAGDVTLLLTEVGGGTVVHLTPEKPEAGREAARDFQLADKQGVPSARNYDRAKLLERRWSTRTLCGREWAIMVGGDGGPLTRFSDVAFAPSCRRCLSLTDRHFPQPPAHDRLGLIAQVTADIVCEYGVAEVHHVPGDQLAALRKAIRMLIRKQIGHGSMTMARDTTLYVSYDAIFEQRREEHTRTAMQAISNALSSSEPEPAQRPEWQLSWDT